MYISEIRIENFRGFGEGDDRFLLRLNPGLTALIGENDTGKTSIIDALRFALGTRDQEYLRVEDNDFHLPKSGKERRKEIRVRCRMDEMTVSEKGAFAEFLTYGKEGAGYKAILYINWTVKDTSGRHGRRFVLSDFRSGENADGQTLDPEARELMRATYLRPLRDAERALSAGRGSRLSQILKHTKEVLDVGADYDPAQPKPDPDTLSVLGVGDYTSALLGSRQGIKAARQRLNQEYLKPLSFSGDDLTGHISVGHGGDPDIRLRQLLEKLELELRDDATPNVPANRGLGSNNLLFMACELLLLGSEEDSLPLLLIEEPEAHLHPQRQLRLMQFLQDQAGIKRADGQKIQIIVTTHSTNLASAIKLDNLALVQNGKAFSLAEGQTKLSTSDYRFLERFLDVTKANLFFARGVIIVEGDSENILLPTLATLIGCDLGAHGVSIVNVGGTGLRRFSSIFQRHDPEAGGEVDVPVACVTDFDVMPDCAPEIVGKVEEGQAWPDKNKRQWRAMADFTEEGLTEKRKEILAKASGQKVETFVSNQWTLEYELAYAGLAKEMWIATQLAKADEKLNEKKADRATVEAAAATSFASLDASSNEKLSAHVYSQFTTGTKASKAIAAQYFAELLSAQVGSGELTMESLTSKLPEYLVSAIRHATRSPATATDTKSDAALEAAAAAQAA